MYIENAYEAPLESIVAHDGQGQIQIGRIFRQEKLQAPWHFFEYLVVPPGATIGEHRHGSNEEIYFILAGQAEMTVNGTRHDVKPGDFILNRSGWAHSLRNKSSDDVKILVIEVGIEGS